MWHFSLINLDSSDQTKWYRFLNKQREPSLRKTCLLPWESFPNSQEPNANEPYLQDKKKDEKQKQKRNNSRLA